MSAAAKSPSRVSNLLSRLQHNHLLKKNVVIDATAPHFAGYFGVDVWLLMERNLACSIDLLVRTHCLEQPCISRRCHAPGAPCWRTFFLFPQIAGFLWSLAFTATANLQHYLTKSTAFWRHRGIPTRGRRRLMSAARGAVF